MLRLRELRGDRLLHALSTHFDLSETKVTANGRIQTRVYQKYGLSIREQIRLPFVEENPNEDDSTEPELEHEQTNGLIDLAEAAAEAQHSEQLPEMRPEPSHAALMQESTAESIRMMWGDRDRLLDALSAQFDFIETKVNGNGHGNGNGNGNGNGHVNGNGRVQTRVYEKFGLHIREQIQLPPAEDQTNGNGSNHSPDLEEDEAFDTHGAASNGLINLADAMQPVERRPAAAREIAPSPLVVGLIRKTLTDLRDLLSDGYRPTIDEQYEDSATDTSQEPCVTPPPAVYGVLSSKRVALIGFSGSQMETLRRGFEDQFSRVLILDWSVLELAIPVLANHDLIVLRLAADEDGRRLNGLASVNKPTLLAGGMEGLIQLNPEYSGTPFDYVAPPYNVAEVVWRSANLLTRAGGSHERAAAGAAVEEDEPQEEDRKTVQVMIAEDDPATATFLETVLASHGMECHVVGNGTDALEMAGAKQIDVSILEIGLSGLDGFQVLAAIKRNPSLAKVRVIFLTARQSEADILRAFGLGADDYITKPFSPMEVAARLKRLLGRTR